MELEEVGNYPPWVLGTKSGPLEEQQALYEAITAAYMILILKLAYKVMDFTELFSHRLFSFVPFPYLLPLSSALLLLGPFLSPVVS